MKTSLPSALLSTYSLPNAPEPSEIR